LSGETQIWGPRRQEPKVETEMTGFIERYRIASENGFDLAQIDPRDKGLFDDREQAEAFTAKAVEKIQQLQYQLFTEGKQSLLIVLQAPDAAGKDGLIRRVLGQMNPQGCRTYSFKVPSSLEASHDFLWRIHAAVPPAGMVSIFNRSHYEDVLAVRVLNLAPEEIWRRRFDHINAFESLLVDRGTRILKFYLHISPEEQLRRFRERLDDPEKHWKLSPADYIAHGQWDHYREAYHDVFQKCSPTHAPWFVIPSDRKWHRNAAAAGIVLQALEEMDPRLPTVDVDFDELRRLYDDAIAALNGGKGLSLGKGTRGSKEDG
jgi:PPK2 family polyphosphate:nucleotide phosphotransferase